ncbi:MAG: glycosyltransferase family 4 protein [Candidatus Parcubacteria bacterium]|nr:glycosyltransferase family 4 protein [Candidatus Parcubacteria bacterium]
MKLLIITQRVDIEDDNLGFFHQWIEKLALKVDKICVICLWEGKHNLPDNVSVYSLGKEKGFSRLRRLLRLQILLLANLPESDGIFIHMCPIYAIASFPLAKIFSKKMILWFLHRSVNWKLISAERCVDRILTASEESCRLKNRKKIKIVGHGIDTELFKARNPESIIQNSKFKILSVGRISPIKDQQTLIEAIDILVNQKNIKDIEVKIIGSPLEESETKYFEQLKKMKENRGLNNYIEFLGSVSYAKLPAYYQEADLSVNLSHTGSIDKVVLEAMASGCSVLTCNEAFQNILDLKYLFNKKDPLDLAEKIINLREAKEDKNLRDIVVKNYNLDALTDKIILEFNVLNKRI